MKKLALISTVLVLVASIAAVGQIRTITGSGNWSNSGNWQAGNIGGGVDNDDDVVMTNAFDITIQNGESYTIASFSVGKSGSLTIDAGGVLIITGTFLADKEFTINVNGDLIIQQDLDVAKQLTLNVTGTLTILGNVIAAKQATVDVQGAMQVNGDFIADKEAIVNVDGTLTVDGDLNLGSSSVITGTGSVSAGSCSGTACGDSQLVPLPVELVSFNASSSAGVVVINWTTATEENNDYFTLERSSDGIIFEEIATISGAGNSTKMLKYQYTDRNPLFGQSYYRLRQTDLDGASETFKPASVYISNIEEVKLSPNPIGQGQTLRIFTGAETGETVVLNIYNAAGTIVYSETLNVNNAEIRLNEDLLPGLYMARVKSGNKDVMKRLLIK